MSESLPTTHIVLDHLLAALDIGVTHFTVCDIREGWGMSFGACKTASLHYCLAGAGALVVHGALRIPLEPHTFVLLPRGFAYRIESASSKSERVEHRVRLCGVPLRESVPTVVAGEGQQGIVTACGELSVGLAGGSDPFSFLGEPLVVRFGGAEGLQDQFVMLLAESARPGAGSRVLTEALLKQCLVLALRRRIEQGASSPLPWLAGVADVRLGRALHSIFDQPAAAFTVERLAVTAGMSRSVFAAAFRHAFGQSPMSLVKVVRLRRAGELLVTTALPVADVAKRVGFSSRSNFSLAFSQFHGMAPSSFRRAFNLAEKR